MRQKQFKLAGFFELPNCIQAHQDLIQKDFWPTFFQREAPYMLELGCGKADFTLGFASQNPDYNCIAIDSKKTRLFDGGKRAIDRNLNHCIFVQMHLEQLNLHIPDHSIDQIWLTFPDPFPKVRHEKHRLSGPVFIKRYQQVLKPTGVFHFKTDNDDLFEYSLEVLKTLNIKPDFVTRDLHAESSLSDTCKIETHFEKRFRAAGKNINYLSILAQSF